MKIVAQRVSSASVTADNSVTGSIKQGLVVFLAIHKDDTEEKIQKMVDKIVKLRIFEDRDGKMNQSIIDIKGEILLVSQFTLYGDTSRGNRPSFIEAADPEKAEIYYEKCITALKTKNLPVATGRFRTSMSVELVNDGPTTLIIDL